VAINDALPLKATRRDATAKFKSLCASTELQTNPMPFHLDLLWGTTLTFSPHSIAHACGMDWDGGWV